MPLKSTRHRYPLMKSVSVLALTILGFTLHSVIHVDAAVIAMTGAVILMLIGVKEHDLEEVFASVEWTTIFTGHGCYCLARHWASGESGFSVLTLFLVSSCLIYIVVMLVNKNFKKTYYLSYGYCLTISLMLFTLLFSAL